MKTTETQINSISELKQKNAAIGNFFFSPATMKSFKTKIESDIIEGKYFITSDLDFNKERVFTIRGFEQSGKIINNPFDKKFGSKKEALQFLKDRASSDLKINFKCEGDFIISYKPIESTICPFDHSLYGQKQRVFKYKVTVKTSLGRVSFDYYGSIKDHEDKKDFFTGNDLAFAFYCFVSDAIAGNETFENFCSEFGYDTDSIKALKIHKACIKSYTKIQTIFPGDLYDLINHLQETYNC